MSLNQVADDGEPKPKPTVGSGRGPVSLTKAVEDVRQKLRTNALARIGDDHFGARVGALYAHLYAPAFGREFHGVKKQIPDNLLQASGITGDGPNARVTRVSNRDIFGV
jgi:hypothetical protein